MKIKAKQSTLSLKSQGILRIFKNHLIENQKTLQLLISQTFGFKKQKFARQQFIYLIKKSDENFIYQQIEQLFNQIDDYKHGFVFFNRINQIYESINLDGNLINQNMINEVIKRLQINSQSKQCEKCLSEVLISYRKCLKCYPYFSSQSLNSVQSNKRIAKIKQTIKQKQKQIQQTFIQKKKQISQLKYFLDTERQRYEKLKSFEMLKGQLFMKNNECTICETQTQTQTQENLRWFNCRCNNVYHFACIRKLQTCPTCRKKLVDSSLR